MDGPRKCTGCGLDFTPSPKLCKIYLARGKDPSRIKVCPSCVLKVIFEIVEEDDVKPS